MEHRTMIVDQTNKHLIKYMGLVPMKDDMFQLFTFNKNPFVVVNEEVAHKIAVNSFYDLTIIEYNCKITGAKYYYLDSYTLD